MDYKLFLQTSIKVEIETKHITVQMLKGFMSVLDSSDSDYPITPMLFTES